MAENKELNTNTENKSEETKATPKKKKKNLVSVFHPQNAKSKEVKNQGKKRVYDKQNKEQNKAVVKKEDEAPKKPLVKVPRAHPAKYTQEQPKPAPMKQQPKKTHEEAAPAETAAEVKVQAAAPVAEAPKAAPAVEAPKAAASEAPKTEAPKAAEKPAENAAGRNDRADRPNYRNQDGEGERRGGFNGDRRNDRGDRNNSYGDRRNDRGNGFNGDRRNDRGDRPNYRRADGEGERRGSFNGDRRNDRGNGFNGDRNNFGGDRNNFGGDRRNDRGDRAGFRNQGDDGERRNNRPGQDNRGSRPGMRQDRKPADSAMDMGMSKPSRGNNHKDKDKDKNKTFLKENKFTNDRSNGKNNNRRKQEGLAKTSKPVHKKEEKKVEKVTEIQIPEKITIRDLAEKMKMQASVIVKKLFMEGMMVTVNQEIDYEKAEAIAMDFDIIAEPEEKVDVIEELLKEEEDAEETMITRAPVVCVMGHVDHGKTSLLDAIRHSHVTSGEAGGITQNIGAYMVEINGEKITFLDTPGHEAFTAMRMRGANSTDIAVLVVAADDGVMPQTVEAINHAKAAGVEIIVAVNKIDKPNANIERVKQELTEYQLVAEDWGGSTIFVPVSAKTKEGIDELLEMILLQAEVLELKANPNRKARALVLEAKLDKGKGPVANILVQKGTLKIGDYIACGAASGRVRAMTDENGRRLKTATPSMPVEVQGLNAVPNAGEILISTETDKEAKNFAATFITESKNKLLEDTRSRMSLDALFSQIQEGDLKDLNIIVKADVQGSVEAVRQSLEKLSNEEVVVKIVHGGVGAINESDVTLAAAANAIIIGFNVHPDMTAKSLAAQEKVDVRLYKVIYQAIEDVQSAMKGMLAPVYEEKVIAHAEIRQLFKASGVGTIAGSYVLDGTIQRGCLVRISREGKQIHEGKLASLKRFKDDVKEVRTGYECGLVFENYNEVQELDIVECYIMVEVPR